MCLINWLTPRALLPQTHFLHILEIFKLDMSQTSVNLLKKVFATWQHAFLSTSFAFCDISAWACTEIKIWSFWTRKWPMSLVFSFSFSFFLAFSFSPFLIFLLQWWTFYWACFLFKNIRDSIIETSIFCHGVATWSGRKFCFEFFNPISEHFHAYLLHIAGMKYFYRHSGFRLLDSGFGFSILVSDSRFRFPDPVFQGCPHYSLFLSCLHFKHCYAVGRL